MINTELSDYIAKARLAGQSDASIREVLIQNGWNAAIVTSVLGSSRRSKKRLLFILVGLTLAAVLAVSAYFVTSFLKNKNLSTVLVNNQGQINDSTPVNQQATDSEKSESPTGDRIVYVYDQQTKKPIADARVSVNFQQLGHADAGEYTTNASGRATLPPNKNVELMKELQEQLKDQQTGPLPDDLFDFPDIGHIHVEKTGYHFNGLNSDDIKNVSEFSIGLTPIHAPADFIFIDCDTQVGAYCNFNRYSEGDAVDLQSLVSLPRRYYRSVAPVTAGQVYDFKFTTVGNEAPERNTIGRGFAVVEFTGDGGIQKVDGGTGGDSGANEFFAFENLSTAPHDGYQKKLRLESGQTYVAKTRDGKHFFKFTDFISKNLDGTSFIEMQIHLQPEASDNLESGKSLAVVPIMNIDKTTIQLGTTSFSNVPTGFFNVDNVGHSDSVLTISLRPLASNMRVFDVSDSSGWAIEPLPPNTIHVYQTAREAKPFVSGVNFHVYGNTSGSLEVVSNGGTETIQVIYP